MSFQATTENLSRKGPEKGGLSAASPLNVAHMRRSSRAPQDQVLMAECNVGLLNLLTPKRPLCSLIIDNK